MSVSFQTIDPDGHVHGDPDEINMHISSAAIVMTALGFPTPQAACDVVGTAVDPHDVLGRCLTFKWGYHLVKPSPGMDPYRLLLRIVQIEKLARRAIDAGHRITWA